MNWSSFFYGVAASVGVVTLFFIFTVEWKR